MQKIVSTPWGLAYITAREVVEYSVYDGWNADGSYNREYNKIPYMDFRDSNRRYIPVNTPWKLKYKTRYQNLLETDELGFLYYHEHMLDILVKVIILQIMNFVIDQKTRW